ncbi:hypothetical protein INR49_020684 [Caranx melampygus]|nr:hypothetical protein INR49_020684 [Caranx melampygus]
MRGSRGKVSSYPPSSSSSLILGSSKDDNSLHAPAPMYLSPWCPSSSGVPSHSANRCPRAA